MLAGKPNKPDLSASCRATAVAASKAAAADVPASSRDITMQPAVSKAKPPGISSAIYKEVLTAAFGTADKGGTENTCGSIVVT
jgi:hypothetical protein